MLRFSFALKGFQIQHMLYIGLRKVELFHEPGEIQRGATNIGVVSVRHQCQYVMWRELYDSR